MKNTCGGDRLETHNRNGENFLSSKFGETKKFLYRIWHVLKFSNKIWRALKYSFPFWQGEKTITQICLFDTVFISKTDFFKKLIKNMTFNRKFNWNNQNHAFSGSTKKEKSAAFTEKNWSNYNFSEVNFCSKSDSFWKFQTQKQFIKSYCSIKI